MSSGLFVLILPGNLLLDFAPQPDGSLPANAVQRYKEFGDWIRGCYGRPVQATNGTGLVLVVQLAGAQRVDRAVVQEAQGQGERVRGYALAAMVGGAWQTVSQGVSVGNKRIDVWAGGAVVATAVRLTVTSAVDVPVISFFGVYDPANC